MIISDLNYLEAVSPETEIVGGNGSFLFNKNLETKVNNNVNLKLNADINSNFKKNADINLKSNVNGNSSTLAFSNEVYSDSESYISKLENKATEEYGYIVSSKLT